MDIYIYMYMYSYICIYIYIFVRLGRGLFPPVSTVETILRHRLNSYSHLGTKCDSRGMEDWKPSHEVVQGVGLREYPNCRADRMRKRGMMTIIALSI